MFNHGALVTRMGSRASQAVGGTFAAGARDLAASLTHVLAKPATLAAIPFLHDADRQSVATAYAALTGPKAVAISLDGSYVYVGSTTAEPLVSDADAERVALQRCEMIAMVVPCSLFAVDAAPVFDLHHGRRQRR